jgi:hypothetical protein
MIDCGTCWDWRAGGRAGGGAAARGGAGCWKAWARGGGEDPSSPPPPLAVHSWRGPLPNGWKLQSEARNDAYRSEQARTSQVAPSGRVAIGPSDAGVGTPGRGAANMLAPGAAEGAAGCGG